MNIQSSATLIALSLVLLGCSTPAPEEVEVAPQPVAQLVPLPNLEALPPGTPRFELPNEFNAPKGPDVIVGRVCRLGTSCLALDPRPFEPCLVGTKHCRDKAHEPVEVQGPVVPHSGVQEISVQEAGAPQE